MTIGKENSVKLDKAADKVEDSKSQIEEVRKLANGRLSEVQNENKKLKSENERLKAELGRRRSTD